MSDKDGNETDNREKFLNAQERNSAFLSLQFIKDQKVLSEKLEGIYQGIYQDPAFIEDDQALDEEIELFIEAMYLALGAQPGSKQLEGFICYCEWQLNQRSSYESLIPILDALGEHKTATMQRARDDIYMDMKLWRDEIRQESIRAANAAFSGSSLPALPAPQPRMRLVHSVEEPLKGKTPAAAKGQLFPVWDRD